MEPNTIAVEPPHGWGGLKTSQSKVAFQWLYYQDQQLGGNRIKHAGNGGEQVIQVKRGKVKVDVYDPITKTIYEFHGCEFHDCKNCTPNNRHVKTFHHPDRTVEEMYQATEQKTRLIRAAGYTVVEMWECTFKKELKQHEKLQDLVKNMTCVPPWTQETRSIVDQLVWSNTITTRKKTSRFYVKISRVCTQRSISTVLTQ